MSDYFRSFTPVDYRHGISPWDDQPYLNQTDFAYNQANWLYTPRELRRSESSPDNSEGYYYFDAYTCKFPTNTSGEWTTATNIVELPSLRLVHVHSKEEGEALEVNDDCSHLACNHCHSTLGWRQATVEDEGSRITEFVYKCQCAVHRASRPRTSARLGNKSRRISLE